MDEVVVKATIVGRIEMVLPLEEDTVISMAAQFFAPDYAPNIEMKEWIQLQQQDPTINHVINLLKQRQKQLQMPKE